uniref:Uncharacterized protein n=1 Tax=Tetranychus urticae TaxID=32264 RepID=T1KBQ0_TETUR
MDVKKPRNKAKPMNAACWIWTRTDVQFVGPLIKPDEGEV